VAAGTGEGAEVLVVGASTVCKIREIDQRKLQPQRPPRVVGTDCGVYKGRRGSLCSVFGWWVGLYSVKRPGCFRTI
jgi:hypothetical protein